MCLRLRNALFAPWEMFTAFLSSADIFFQNEPFRNMIRVSNSIDPDQARHSVWPDLGPHCLQKLSVDNTRR